MRGRRLSFPGREVDLGEWRIDERGQFVLGAEGNEELIVMRRSDGWYIWKWMPPFDWQEFDHSFESPVEAIRHCRFHRHGHIPGWCLDDPVRIEHEADERAVING